jgi:hypothetical protein
LYSTKYSEKPVRSILLADIRYTSDVGRHSVLSSYSYPLTEVASVKSSQRLTSATEMVELTPDSLNDNVKDSSYSYTLELVESASMTIITEMDEVTTDDINADKVTITTEMAEVSTEIEKVTTDDDVHSNEIENDNVNGVTLAAVVNIPSGPKGLTLLRLYTESNSDVTPALTQQGSSRILVTLKVPPQIMIAPVTSNIHGNTTFTFRIFSLEW